MDKKILKQLKSDYEELEIKPSSDLWDQIDASLEKKPEVILQSATSFQWWKYAAVILLLISVGTLIFYNRDFNAEKANYAVKKNVEKEVLKNENRSELITDKESLNENISPKIVKEEAHQKILHKYSQNLKITKENSPSHISERTETKIVLNKSEINDDKQEKVENHSLPLVSNTPKVSYVTANDLLLARELDVSREKANEDARRFGVIPIDKVIPKLGNVTVLGVTVYVDPK
ncbi:hypothetical protein OMO38_10835 [Chryseobacterium sp. 09-1422]|uniref:Uncharacterized protein n=1 Tax=Chryseobacterium kimseyorum TaxID=2984028 RepID=A0ABT3HYY9_9FLAO|nr:hypothetical protein [Chryseobacterium kimseyorum]MCW3169019.1 hypothetical protein [Chryseobacterium kimseyorum]